MLSRVSRWITRKLEMYKDLFFQSEIEGEVLSDKLSNALPHCAYVEALTLVIPSSKNLTFLFLVTMPKNASSVRHHSYHMSQVIPI